jgi:hypothetical protein
MIEDEDLPGLRKMLSNI